MSWTIETLGDASMLLSRDGAPLLAGDPWLDGRVCYGSWARERDLAPTMIEAVARAPFVVLSSAAAGRFHLPSLRRFARGCDILLPEGFDPAAQETLFVEGFTTRLLPFKRWVELASGLRIMSVASAAGAVLAIEADGMLILDKNDAPLRGEEHFFRRLVRASARACLLALPECAPAAEDFHGHRPALAKRRAVAGLAGLCADIGIGHYLAAAPHRHVREDSQWADAWRLRGIELKRLWPAAGAIMVEPFASFDPARGVASPVRDAAVLPHDEESELATGADDWSEPLSSAEWYMLDCFAKGAAALKGLDFVAFNVGGESRKIALARRGRMKPLARQRGIVFAAPRHSLMAAVRQRRFADLLAAHIVKPEFHNCGREALVGFERPAAPESRRDAWRSLRRSPRAYLAYRREIVLDTVLAPAVREALRWIGVFETLRRLRARAEGSSGIGSL